MADEVILVEVKYETDSAVKEVDDLTSSLEGNKVALASVQSQLQKGAISQKEASTQTAKLKQEIARETKERRVAIKALQSEKNTREGIRATVQKLKQDRDKLDTTNKRDVKRIKQLNKEIEKQNKRLGETSSKTEGLRNAISQTIPGLGALTNSTKAFFKLLLTNPIGLIVAALASLIAFFKRSEEGQNALRKVTTVFMTVLNNFLDIISKIGKALFDAISNPRKAWEEFKDFIDRIGAFFQNTFGNIIGGAVQKFVAQLGKGFAAIGLAWQKFKNLFTDNAEGIERAQGRIAELNNKIAASNEKIAKGAENLGNSVKKGWENAKQGLSGFIDEQQREIEIAKNLADRQAALDKAERVNLVRTAELRRDIANLRAQAADKENVDAETRLNLLDQAIIKENEILNLTQGIAAERLALQQIQNSLADSTKEDLEEEARLQAELIQLETTNADRRRRLLSERLTAEREIKAQDRALELEFELEHNADLLELDKEYADQEKAIFQQLEDDKLAATEERINRELELEQLKRDTTFELASIASNAIFDIQRNRLRAETTEALKNENLTEKQKEKIRKKAAKEEQKIAIKQAIINGALAVTRALFDPGGLAGAAYALVVGAATLAEIATIKSQSFGKGGKVTIAKNGAKFGTFDGPSHSGGGIDLFTGSGQHVANVEGKENFYVLNKNASDYINALSDINQRIGGGVPLSNKAGKMQDGGQADLVPEDTDIDDLTERVVKNLPPIIVKTVDIKTGLEARDEVLEVGVI